MTKHGRVLPTPDDPRIAAHIEVGQAWAALHRRSAWLATLEKILREHYPQASSRDLNVTARSLAPFPLAEKDWL